MVALRPRTETTAPVRLAAVRSALVVGVFAVLLVEAAGALHLLTAPALTVGWLIFVLGCAGLAARRWPGSPDWHRLRVGALRSWRTGGRVERLLIGSVGVLVLAELLVAVLAEPNNFDSQTYHLPKVEHWAAQRNLDFWATAIHRQVTIPPGAEYLLLHLRLLTGGDLLYNLVQFAAGLGCLLIASRITAQLGGGRRAQLITVFVLGTTPMVVLQATSTQTDLVVAAWTGCVATIALDGLRRPASPATVLALGAATGLTALTKTSGLLGAGPMLVLWGLAQLRWALTAPRRPAPVPDATGPGRAVPGATGPDAARPGPTGPGATGRRAGGVLKVAAASAGVLLMAAMVVGPFLLRVTAEFGNPLGPPRLRESIPMQRHDPPAVLVNGLRVAHTALDTPIAPLRQASAAAITGFARLIGIDPQERAITFGSTRFPVPAWYPDEDRVAFPVTGVLVLIALGAALARPARLGADRAGLLRAYGAATAAAVLLYPLMIKWQPWGNRLLLYTLVLATPLVGLWADAVFRRHARAATSGVSPTREAGGAGTGTSDTGASSTARSGPRRVGAGVLAVVLATAALAGVLSVSYGFPRRLVGAGSTLTTDDWQTRFLRRPQWAGEFRWAARLVTESGARRVGLVQQNDNWEYPWWLLLRQHEIVALQSVLPDRPAPDPTSVDVIVCTGDRAVCRRHVPAGWTLAWNGYAGYAAPPRR